MDDLYTRFDNIFFERTRLSILSLTMADAEVSFTSLKQRIGGTDGALYTHLEKLVQAGYIEKERDTAGKSVRTLYSITPLGKETYNEYLQFLHRMLQIKTPEKGEDYYENS